MSTADEIRRRRTSINLNRDVSPLSNARTLVVWHISPKCDHMIPFTTKGEIPIFIQATL